MRAGFAVIVPCYQRSPGVIREALASVAAQEGLGAAPLHVYVVDDGSPVDPGEEAAAVDWPASCRVRLLRKPNGGVSSARNWALERLQGEEGIAFLDADDRWLPHHLASARHALESGFDLYAADMQTLSGQRHQALFFRDALPLQRFGDEPWAHELTAELADFTVASPLIPTPSLVVSRALLGESRFHEGLRLAGEDGLFKTALAVKRPRVMVSSRVDVVQGRGVNIFSQGEWGTADAFRRAADHLRSRYLMQPLLEGFPAAQRRLRRAIGEAETGFWRAALAAQRRRELPKGALARTVSAHPRLVRRLPRAALGAWRRSGRGAEQGRRVP